MTKIGSVISFCTHDVRFLDKCLSSVCPFSDQIIIPICDHFYNGEPENLPLLNQIYSQYPNVDFIEFSYSTKEVYGTPVNLVPNSPGWSQHWHNSARLIGSYFVKPEIDYLLFLDVDEIFSKNLKKINFASYEAIRFATYWYFKSPRFCATITPDGPLLIKRKILSAPLLLNEDERMGMYERVKGKKKRQFLVDEKPIVHHYSWVRTREEMLQKVRRWGHHWERDWEKLIDQEEDFVRHYSYRKIPLFWDPYQASMRFSKKQKRGTNVRKVTPKEIFRMEINCLIEN